MAGEYVELTAADLAHRWRERTVLESVDESVAQAGEAEEYATPDSALRWLLRLAWSDLESARKSALNGRWSMTCEGHVERIVGITRLVGILSWEHVSVDLILDGVYERIHEAMGSPSPLTDDDRRRAQEVKDRRAVPFSTRHV
jgi:hypothetical protein